MDEPSRPGAVRAGGPPARYIGDAATLVRLHAGRPLNGDGHEPAGVTEGELSIFG
ncbi:hypothetical protein [Streptomyces sp. NPDC002520]